MTGKNLDEVFATIKNVIVAREESHGSVGDKSVRYSCAGMDLKGERITGANGITDKLRAGQELTADDIDEIVDDIAYKIFLLSQTEGYKKLPEWKIF